MRLKRKKRQNAEIDVGAFSDIAFLLIIFFILTTTFLKPFGSQIDIPAGTSDPENQQEKTLTVTLRGDRVFYGEEGTEMTFPDLQRQLVREKISEKPEKDRFVIVESAPDVPYQNYFEVVMAITRAGGALALVDEEASE